MSGDSIDWPAQDWDDLVPRLTLLAVLRLAGPALGDDIPPPAPRGDDAQDIVREALSVTLSGRRPWVPDAGTLYEHLAEIVAEGAAAKAGLRAPPIPGAQEEAWRADRRRLLDDLYDKDEKLGEMASLMLLETCLETAELAEALEVVPVEVSNLKRRMKREVQGFILGRRS